MSGTPGLSEFLISGVIFVVVGVVAVVVLVVGLIWLIRQRK